MILRKQKFAVRCSDRPTPIGLLPPPPWPDLVHHLRCVMLNSKKCMLKIEKKNLLVILLGPPHNPPQKWTAQKFDLTNYLANSYEKNIMVNFFG